MRRPSWRRRSRMRDKPLSGTRCWWWSATVLLVAALGPTTAARGQGNAAQLPVVMPTVVDEDVKPIPTTPTDGGVTPAGCSTCGGGLLGGGGDGGCAGCGGCGSGQCSPSRRECDCCCSSDTCLGRFVN